ncbi:anthranilate phosphoribosyltransferase [Clostridium polyendosporum]|uniref:Anthranilate phosphoribosyltransferase n=1 Tax=Clostridium polyendosporum TaxID=69208 RepID=A0A919S068_9CLOT|nr:anthranilate phosphoribosyltransferase [Clostridium polyendosporum]GIM29810.1 anthranilate phosphoribosyltransferase [Clostridium polyendosporum]
MINNYVERLIVKENLSEEEMTLIMDNIMEGKLTNSQIASFLTALRIKGENVDEITAAARVMRSKVIPLGKIDEFTIDTCGTGGDKKGTFNVSTAVSMIAAAAGITVVKHGNRSVSSNCGSADVLETLGVNISMAPEDVYQCIKEVNIGFLFAPTFHPAMKYAAVPRREMGIRTIFNILGPLTNPASANGQVLGVFSPALTESLAKVLKNLGTERAMVVHGLDGMDEITLSGDTQVSELRDGEIETYIINPSDFGLKTSDMSEVIGGDSKKNAQIIIDIFNGENGSKRDIVLLNAAAALVVGKKAKDMNEGIEMAKEIIDSGKAMKKLNEWKSFCERVK